LADCHAQQAKGRIDEATLAFVQKQFSVPEIIELAVYFAMVTGFQRFNSVFQIEYGCPLPHPEPSAAASS
jgi:hypothetical protein